MGDVASLAGGADDKLDRAAAHVGGVGAHRGQADAPVGRQRNIVEADDGNVLGDAQAAPFEAVHGGDGQHVVMGGNGGGALNPPADPLDDLVAGLAAGKPTRVAAAPASVPVAGPVTPVSLTDDGRNPAPDSGFALTDQAREVP